MGAISALGIVFPQSMQIVVPPGATTMLRELIENVRTIIGTNTGSVSDKPVLDLKTQEREAQK